VQEFERNDMVEYLGEQLEGFVFSEKYQFIGGNSGAIFL
jgi:methionine synthase II (cobalamin-independent)